MNTRRHLGKIVGAFAAIALLNRCAGANPTVVSAQALAYANAAVNALPGLLTGIQNIAPKAIPKGGALDIEITNITASLKTSLSTLTVNSPATTAATTLEAVVQGVNTVLQVIGAVLPAAAVAFPALAPYIGIYDAVVALLPGIEVWISTVISTAPTTTVTPKALINPVAPIQHIYTPDQALTVLSLVSP